MTRVKRLGPLPFTKDCNSSNRDHESPLITTTEQPPRPTSPPQTLTLGDLPPWLQSALAKLDRRVEQGTLTVPLLPEAAATLLLMTEDEDADLDRLAEVVRADPTMAAQLLRIANSPLFVSRYPIASIRTALSRLGMFQVRQIALLIVCDTKVFRVRGWEAPIRKLFEHSVLVALFAQEIAKKARMNADEAFLAGLLHDVGIPTLVQGLVEIEPRVTSFRNIDNLLTLLHPRHAEIGARLAAAWAMPPRLIEAIGYHHEPHLAKSDGRNAMVLYLANQLAGHGPGHVASSGKALSAPSGEFRAAREVSGEFELPVEAAALSLSNADIAELLAMRQALTTKVSTVS
jgi:putative nucleotidyltransferase with HDIG domain